MYDRYGDISKFITDAEQLCVVKDINDEIVYLSKEKDYDIAVDLEECYAPFEKIRSFLAFLSAHICELDNTVQWFDRHKRIKSHGYVRLPSPPGTLRFDYSQSIEDIPSSEGEVEEKKAYPYILTFIYLEKPNFVTLEYWCTTKNSQFEAVFEYKEGGFFLRSFGIFDCIPDNWNNGKGF